MIGLFDSGSGGLTVLRAVHTRMPRADFVYFGDIENMPYGNKSSRKIKELTAMALLRLRAAGATHIVNSCNTSSAAVHSAMDDLLRVGKSPMINMVEPTVNALVKRNKKTVIFCTRSTADSGAYQEQCVANNVDASVVALPDLAGLIENDADATVLKSIIRDAVDNALANGARVISLGCTHFPLARDLFEECAREYDVSLEIKTGVEVFDPADAVAEAATKMFPNEGRNSMRFLLSAPSSAFKRRVAKLFPGMKYTIELAGSADWALNIKHGTGL